MAKAREKSSKRSRRPKNNPALISAKELRSLYADGVRNFDGSALTGQDLSGMDLRGSSFRGANLYNVNFSEADIRGVDFTGSDLGNTNFQGAIRDALTVLVDVNLEGTRGTPNYDKEALIDIFAGHPGRIDPVVSAKASNKKFDEEAKSRRGSYPPGSVPKMQLSRIDTPNRLLSPGPRVELDGRIIEVSEPTIEGMPLDEFIDYVRNEFAGAGFDMSGHEILRYDQYEKKEGVRSAYSPFYISDYPWFSDADEWLSSVGALGYDAYLDDGGNNYAALVLDGVKAESEWDDYFEGRKLLIPPVSNPKRGKPSSSRRKANPTDAMLARAHRLWEAYDAKPLKRNLVAFGNHVEKMKASSSAKVKAEARRALRAYNSEFRARGWKRP